MIVDLGTPPQANADKPVVYRETIQTPEFRGGHYVLQAGADDLQQPHREDEAYLVLSGRATFEEAGERQPVRQGHVIIVKAGVPHRFVEIEEDVTLFVLFAKR
jgi:quercetin dioxygenase-like cupin family protein